MLKIFKEANKIQAQPAVQGWTFAYVGQRKDGKGTSSVYKDTNGRAGYLCQKKDGTYYVNPYPNEKSIPANPNEKPAEAKKTPATTSEQQAQDPNINIKTALNKNFISNLANITEPISSIKLVNNQILIEHRNIETEMILKENKYLLPSFLKPFVEALSQPVQIPANNITSLNSLLADSVQQYLANNKINITAISVGQNGQIMATTDQNKTVSIQDIIKNSQNVAEAGVDIANQGVFTASELQQAMKSCSDQFTKISETLQKSLKETYGDCKVTLTLGKATEGSFIRESLIKKYKEAETEPTQAALWKQYYTVKDKNTKPAEFGVLIKIEPPKAAKQANQATITEEDFIKIIKAAQKAICKKTTTVESGKDIKVKTSVSFVPGLDTNIKIDTPTSGSFTIIAQKATDGKEQKKFGDTTVGKALKGAATLGAVALGALQPGEIDRSKTQL